MTQDGQALNQVEFRRALVTGAGGCIGRALVRRLVTQGCELNALDVDPVALEALVEAHPRGAIRPFRGSLADPLILNEAAEGVEAVFHTAAKVHSIPRRAKEDAEFFEVNVTGTTNLLQHGKTSTLRSFVFFSTIAVYGTGDGTPLAETTSVNPENAYARSKLEAEQRIQGFFRQSQVRPTIFRMSLVYGEGERGNFSRMMRSVDAGRFVMVGDGRSRKSMIYVEDVASAAILAAQSPAAQGETFVLSDPQPYSLRQVVETLARHLNVSPPRLRMPLPVLRLGGGALDLAGRTLGFRPMFTKADVDKLMTDTVCDVSKIRHVLGFESQCGLDEGVRRTVRWYRGEQTRRKGVH
jgi:UDP-glucose 4-epimerase